MPIVSAFYGMVIRIYFDDHNPPHFHVSYGNKEIAIAIESGKILGGKLPTRLMNAIREWHVLHKQELLAAWHDVQQMKKPNKIKPLE